MSGPQSPQLEPPADRQAQQLLGHVSLNDTSTADTVVLLHGMGASHNEWQLVWPHLTGRYHVLAVDLPGHASSAAIIPAGIVGQAAAVASLIRARAHGGMAHVVGLSMGGFVAVELARSHASLIQSAFASGAALYSGFRLWVMQHPVLFNGVGAVQKLVPAWLESKMEQASHRMQAITVTPELARDMKQNDPSRYRADFLASVGRLTLEGMDRIKVRVLTAAGGKMDDVEGTRRQGDALRIGCSLSRAVVVRRAWHGWSLQLPELFAEGIAAWVEGKQLPAEFEDLCC